MSPSVVGFDMRFLVAAALATLWACSESSEGPLASSETPTGLEFAVASEVYSVGDTAEVVLANRSDMRLGYNLCTAKLERQRDSTWEAIERHPGIDCTLPQGILDPGASVSELQPIGPWMPSGVYRFRDEVEWPLGGESHTVISNEFRIDR